MPGELSDDHVLVNDPAEASALYNRGYFGTPRSGGALELDLLEVVYLVEADRLEVRRGGRRVSARDLYRAAGPRCLRSRSGTSSTGTCANAGTSSSPAKARSISRCTREAGRPGRRRASIGSAR